MTRIEQFTKDGNGVPAYVGYPGTVIEITSSDTPVNTSASEKECIVRVTASFPCRVAFGVNAVASGTSMYVNADQPEYFLLKKGHRISVLGARLNIAFIKTI